MKRLLSAVVCLAMLLTMLPAVAVLSAQAAEDGTYTYVGKKPASIIPADNGTKGAWYNNGSTFVTEPGNANYVELVDGGYKDAGVMHVYQDDVANNDMSLGMFLGGQLAGTYTVKMYVKGDLGLAGQTCTFFIPGTEGQCPNLHGLLGTTDVADWTEISYNVEVANDFYYLIFSLSKYNWKTDFYVDNIQLLNSSGVDVLAGGGNFYVNEEITTTSAESGQWPLTFDTTAVSSAYSSFAGKWTTMFPTGAPNDSTWPAWDDAHYGEIVADGYADAGSLHLVSAARKNTGIAINAGMTVGQTYTLGLWAKGTVNTGKVMGMYGNGDGVIIGDTASFGAGWNHYELTFTAGMSQINIVAADWGDVDILVDNITLTDADGNDLLAGYGDFYTDVDPNLVAVAVELDTSKLSDLYNAPAGEWVPFSPYLEYKETWPAWEAGVNYGEIALEGHKDAGSLHLVSAATKNTGVVINAGMNPGESYTLGLWVKGSAASNKMLAIYGNGDVCMIGNPQYCGDVCLSAVPADWTYIEKTFTATHACLAILAADWGSSDLYIDNITLKNSAGVDLLDGYGDFCVLQDPTIEVMTINTEAPQASWGGAPKGQWSLMYETGAPVGNDEGGTWPVWDDTHYGEIVAEGYKDLGALHLVSDARKNTAVAIGADMVSGESYKLSFWAKGTANTGRVLFSYGNGDVVVIEAGADLGADWTHYEATIVANRNQLNLVAADWGSVDIYIDNVTLTDADGNDLLEGCGNFYQKIQEEEPEQPTEPPVEPDVEGLGVIGDELERVFRWYWEHAYEQTDHNLVEIVPAGAEDNGALHIWQSAAAPADAVLSLATPMAGDLESGSYTLTMKVKGTFYNTEGFFVYPVYCNEAQLAELSVNNKLKNAEGVTYADGAYTADSWIDLSWTLPASPEDGENGFMFLALSFSKYNVGEYWVDNIRVLDPAGNDMLGGAGSFMDSGSEYFPIILPETGAEILNSNTMYYQIPAGDYNVSVSNHVESGVTCGDQNFSVTYNGVTQNASDKNVTMQMSSADEPIVFTVSSNAGSVEIPGSVFEMAQRAGEFNIYDVVITPVDCEHAGMDAVEWTEVKAPTFTEEGQQVKYCGRCGEIVATETIPMLTAAVHNWNIALDDDLVATFHLNVSDYAYAHGGQVQITMGSRSATYALDSLQKDDFGMAMAVVHVPAPYMTENIVITVSVGDAVSLDMTYTVRQYADTILSLEAYSAYHALVKEMLNYGAAAQVQFGVNTGNLANANINGAGAAEVPGSIDSKPTTTGSLEGISFYGATLVCENKTAVRLYFTVTGDIADYAVEGYDFQQKEGRYYIEIAGIRPENLDEIIEIAVTDTDGNAMTVSYSPLQYMVRMNIKGSTQMQALVKALYNYHLAAQTLRAE